MYEDADCTPLANAIPKPVSDDDDSDEDLNLGKPVSSPGSEQPRGGASGTAGHATGTDQQQGRSATPPPSYDDMERETNKKKKKSKCCIL